jgi:hypothetical protein
VRDTLILQDVSGRELFKVQKQMLHVRDTMTIERDGASAATVKKALIHAVRDRFSIEVEGGENLEAKGNIVDHEYKIERNGDHVAEISKRWFRVREHVRHRDRWRRERRAASRGRRLHRPDLPRLTPVGSGPDAMPPRGTTGRGTGESGRPRGRVGGR